MYKRFWRRLIFLFIALVAIEAILRLIGFGQVPCYHSSRVYEYALKPNQHVYRFGNHFNTNSFGMRSPEVVKGFKHILKFGDSVLNGGVATDQSELASSLLQNALAQKYDSVQVLNISAGSWGPDNAFKWMTENGDFHAAMIVLVFSSHDWTDHMTFRDVVGRVPFYPKNEPKLAISDAISWVFSRYFEEVKWDEIPILPNISPEQLKYTSGWPDFINYADSANIPVIVYHHADRNEFENQEWNAKGKALELFLNHHKVNHISGFDSGFTESDYRDEIHPNASGQAKIEAAIEPRVLQDLKKIEHE